MTTIATNGAASAAIGAAKDVPDLIAKLNAIDPALGEQIQGKALIASKTPLGTVIGLVLGWAIPHYGLACSAVAIGTDCWSSDTVSFVSGIGALIGTAAAAYVMRWVTKAPIAGIVSVPPPPVSAAPVITPVAPPPP